MDRRSFIKVSTSATGGLALSYVVPGIGKKLLQEKEPFSPNVLTEIHSDGSITFTLTKHEMGQGTGSGIPMVYCDELGANWETLKVVQAVHDPQRYGRLQGNTGGSSGLMTMWQPVREIAATTRELLLNAAAKDWQVSKTNLTIENGLVKEKSSSRTAHFGEFISTASQLPVPGKSEVELKKHADFKLIGTPARNKITPKIVRGEKYFAMDMKLPGMVYASIERCPVYRGKIRDFDATAARKLSGVIDVIKVPEMYESANFIVREGLAVIATSTWAAMQGRKALVINWDYGVNGSRNNASLRREMQALADKGGDKLRDFYGNFGDVDTVLAEADEVLNVTYENAFHAHACMEPMNAVAHIKDGKCELWAPMQNPNSASQKIARYGGIPQKDQTVHVMPSGGSFGRKFYPEHVAETAFLAKRLEKPIKLTWTREDDIRLDYNSAFQHDNLKVGIKDGQVVAWHTNVVSTNSWSPGPWIPYIVPNKRGENHIVTPPVPIGAWRSVGEHRAGFAMEGMMDELAHKFGKDPLTFRLEMLDRQLEAGSPAEKFYGGDFAKDAIEKTRTVLKLAAEKANWGKKMPANSGQGIAAYRFNRSYCAQVVEVAVNAGNVEIKKVTAALYCGTAVNPHFIKGQVEGAIIWAITSVLYGGMEIVNGQVQQSNFDTYEILRMDEIPEFDIHIVPSEDPAVGVGEPGVPPLTPALMNAIFAATGKRLRKTPLRKEDLV